MTAEQHRERAAEIEKLEEQKERICTFMDTLEKDGPKELIIYSTDQNGRGAYKFDYHEKNSLIVNRFVMSLREPLANEALRIKADLARLTEDPQPAQPIPLGGQHAFAAPSLAKPWCGGGMQEAAEKHAKRRDVWGDIDQLVADARALGLEKRKRLLSKFSVAELLEAVAEQEGVPLPKLADGSDFDPEKERHWAELARIRDLLAQPQPPISRIRERLGAEMERVNQFMQAGLVHTFDDGNVKGAVILGPGMVTRSKGDEAPSAGICPQCLEGRLRRWTPDAGGDSPIWIQCNFCDLNVPEKYFKIDEPEKEQGNG